jgi:hypothetical protein
MRKKECPKKNAFFRFLSVSDCCMGLTEFEEYCLKLTVQES